MPAAFGGGNVDIRDDAAFRTGPVVNVEIGSGLELPTASETGYRVSRRRATTASARTTARGRSPPRCSKGIQTYLGNISAASIQTGLNRDGTLHPISEAQAVNRDLAISAESQR